jgi:hypothetical protein
VAEIGGDVSGLSELDRLAISQAASLMLQIETLQAAQVAGERIDQDAIIRTSSECRRSLDVLRTKAAAARHEAKEAARQKLWKQRLEEM